jgi:hypothetical protein
MKLNVCKCGFLKEEHQKFCCIMCSLNKGHGPRCKQITQNNIVVNHWLNIIEKNSKNINLENINNLYNYKQNNNIGPPDSFSFIATYNVVNELKGMLLSLSLNHPNAIVYGFVDIKTKKELETMTPKIKLDLILEIKLEKYSNKNREQMENENIWSDFQMEKARVISYSLQYSSNTLFLDSDIIFFNAINCIDKSKDMALSPHYIKKSACDLYGYYNGGILWVNKKGITDDWIEFTKKSRYYDQASIEELAKKYNFQILGPEINITPWRLFHVDNKINVIKKIKCDKNNIYYNNKQIVFIHTHFNKKDCLFHEFNTIFLKMLYICKKYRELLIIDYVKNNKWIINIPSQPRNDIWIHANDSFRELAYLSSLKNNDLKIDIVNQNHCTIFNKVLLYDRPNKEWMNNDIYNYLLVKLGNGSMEDEGKYLKDKGLNTEPWIFWPRSPKILENLLENYPPLSFEDRLIESIFIGNYENNIQEKFRKTNINWDNIITEFHCTSGNKHKFTQEQYLLKLRIAKYGLCLRGFGSKCHREVELMAFGTVPIITPEVEIKSYINPPQENIHYIKVSNPDEYKEKIKNISQEKWNEMSKTCIEWYKNNVNSNNAWITTISSILYKI